MQRLEERQESGQIKSNSGIDLSALNGVGSNLRKTALGLASVLTFTGAGVKEAEGANMLVSVEPPGQAYIDAAQPYLDYVVAIQRVDPSSGVIDYATGVRIAPNKILTAGHVVDYFTGLRDPSSLAVFTGGNFLTPDASYSVGSVSVHSSYTPGTPTQLGGNRVDLGVITTTQNMVGSIIPLLNEPITNSTLVSAVTYGRPQYGIGNTLLPYDGFARLLQFNAANPTSQFNNDIYGGSRISGVVSPTLGVLTLGGSGSPILYNGALGGIGVAGSQTGSFWADTSYSPARDYILNNYSVPEPSVAMTFAFGVGLIAASRRRR